MREAQQVEEERRGGGVVRDVLGEAKLAAAGAKVQDGF